MTWRDLLKAAGEALERAGVREYEADAWELFSECFGMSRATYFLRRDEIVSGGEDWNVGELFRGETAPDEMKLSQRVEESIGAMGGAGRHPLVKFVQFIHLREQRIPLQQITGHQEFMGLDFLVNEHVLIPRQDTEVLVETVLEDLRSAAVPEGCRHTAAGENCSVGDGRKTSPGNCQSETSEPLRILDMCAGSGCIGISLERLAPMPVSVLGADVSDEALKVAAANGRRLGCERYRGCKSDLFAQIEGSFDVIVSNPPYIATAVIDTLDVEVKDHEPRLALDGEADGLTFYRRLAAEAPEYLADGGRMYLEIGYDQGEAVSGLLREVGFSEVRVIRDLAGLDRVVAAVYSGER